MEVVVHLFQLLLTTLVIVLVLAIKESTVIVSIKSGNEPVLMCVCYSNITVLNGSSVTLRCVLQEIGSPAATIKWMFSGNAISTSSKYTITDNSTQLNINIVNTSDTGIYYCQATNIVGSSTAAITLQVQSLL